MESREVKLRGREWKGAFQGHGGVVRKENWGDVGCRVSIRRSKLKRPMVHQLNNNVLYT
jgi:hypothetical protein